MESSSLSSGFFKTSAEKMEKQILVQQTKLRFSINHTIQLLMKRYQIAVVESMKLKARNSYKNTIKYGRLRVLRFANSLKQQQRKYMVVRITKTKSLTNLFKEIRKTQTSYQGIQVKIFVYSFQFHFFKFLILNREGIIVT